MVKVSLDPFHNGFLEHSKNPFHETFSKTQMGPLEFVPTLDEIRHRIDHTVMGKLNGKSLTIFQKKVRS